MIAFDSATSSSDTSGSATTLTYAHTNTGSNLILFVGVSISSGSDLNTGVTYNANAMSLAGKIQRNGGASYEYLWYLVAPTTGAHNVVVTLSSGANIGSGAVSYTGAKQTGQPDSANTGTTAGTSLSVSTTVVLPNCWLVASMGCANGPFNFTTGTGRTGDGGNIMGDSNAIVGTGSQPLVAGAPTGPIGGVISSFAPAVSPSGFFAFM